MTSANTRELLEEVGRAMYGDQWQTALSRDLSVSDRTVRRWHSYGPPPDIAAKLCRIAQTRAEALMAIVSSLEGRPAL